MRTTADRLDFENVRLLGNQDTFDPDIASVSSLDRVYVHNSYIEGDVDFIFGHATAVFDQDTIHSLDRGSSSNNGYVTASATEASQPHGFLIINSTLSSSARPGMARTTWSPKRSPRRRLSSTSTPPRGPTSWNSPTAGIR